eukprot:g6297.t1
MFATRSEYDRGVNTFSPEGRLFQVEYAIEAIKLGSTAVGIQTKEGVILAVEKRLTSPLLEPSSVEKIMEVDSHIGAAMSGLIADARTLVDHARVEAQNHRFTYDEPMRVEALTQAVCDLALSFGEGGGSKTMSRPFGVALLMAGFDDRGAQLFFSDPSGMFVRYKCKAIGSGSEGAQSTLQEGYSDSLTLAEAEALAVSTLKQVMEEKINPDNVEVASVTQKGYSVYTPEQLTELKLKLKLYPTQLPETISMMRATATRLVATRLVNPSQVCAAVANSSLLKHSSAACRSIGTKREIGEGMDQEEIRPGERSQVHFRATPTRHPLGMGSPGNTSGTTGVSGQTKDKGKEWSMPHEIWSAEEVNSIKATHKEPEEAVDHIALRGVRALRWSFDVLAGFKTGVIDEHKYLNRVIFLETVAGIPGMVAGTLRHLTSLRRMRRDHGWIHTLLEEAENERMHLLTFLKLKKPGPIFRFAVMISQGVMYNAFFLSYIISPKACHRFVGYIEEEAVHTYTVLLEDIDANKLPLFSNLPAPAMAKSYWKLGEDAMFRDLVLAVRADEANHCVVNHTFADMHQEFKEDAVNPFSIHAGVTKYSDVGVTPPAVADINNSGDEIVMGNANGTDHTTASSQQQQQQQQ